MASAVCDNSSSPNCSEKGDDVSGVAISVKIPVIMMSTGVTGNLISLYILFTAHRQARRAPFFPILLTTACTHLLGQVATSPVAIVVYSNNRKWVGGRPLCLYHGFVMVFFCVVTPLLICSMAVERMVALKYAYFYKRCFTNYKSKLIVVGIYVFALLFCTCALVGFGSYEMQFPGTWCFLNFHKYSTSDVIYALLFSCLNITVIGITILCNAMTVWTLVQMRRMRIERKLMSAKKLEVEMMWFLMIITVLFSCFWLPLNIHILENQITGENDLNKDLRNVRLASINQIVDPWLYVILRKKAIARFCKRCRRLFTSGTGSITTITTTEQTSRSSLSESSKGRKSIADATRKSLAFPQQVARQTMPSSQPAPSREEVELFEVKTMDQSSHVDMSDGSHELSEVKTMDQSSHVDTSYGAHELSEVKTMDQSSHVDTSYGAHELSEVKTMDQSSHVDVSYGAHELMLSTGKESPGFVNSTAKESLSIVTSRTSPVCVLL